MPVPFQIKLRGFKRCQDGSTSIRRSVLKKSKTKNWRDQQKITNPEKYKKNQEDSVKYGRLYRLEMALAEDKLKQRNLSNFEKEEADKWLERKHRYNEGCRKRMNKMNERKRQAQKEATKNGKISKPMTRKEHDKQKEKERTRKQKQRAKTTQEQRLQHNAKRHQGYQQHKADTTEKALQEEKRKLEEKEKKLKEMAELLREQEREIETTRETLNEQNEQLVDDAVDLRSNAAKRKSLQHAKAGMPQRRTHFVSTTVQLINQSSPTKAASFKKAGVILTKSRESQRQHLEDGVMEVVATTLKTPRQSAKKKKPGNISISPNFFYY